MITDILEACSDHLGEQVGDFYGTPIRIWDASATRFQEDLQALSRVQARYKADYPDLSVEEREALRQQSVDRGASVPEAVRTSTNIIPAGVVTEKVSLPEAQKRLEAGALILWRPNVDDFSVPLDRSQATWPYINKSDSIQGVEYGAVMNACPDKHYALVVIPTDNTAEVTQ